MGNKQWRKPRVSVKLMRKRLGRNKRSDAQPPAAHSENDSTQSCSSVNEINVPPPAAHSENDSTQGCSSVNEINVPSPSTHFDDQNEDINFVESHDNVTTTGNVDNSAGESKYGRRIVNINQFFTQLQEISSHGPLNCGLQSVEIVSETRTGLISQLALKCKMCNVRFLVHNDNAADALDLNTSAVADTVATGCGYTQLSDLLAAIGIAPMSKAIFSAKLSVVHKKWEEELLKSITEAAEEERSLAIAEGRVNSDGIAIIDVIADGCYSKRSYKKNYSALSGAAAIIGKRTNKILYLAIKNKYCSICAVAQSKNVEAKEHTCFKNYSAQSVTGKWMKLNLQDLITVNGTGSSSGMESEILVEGFKRSIEMHNIVYGRLISDGDANTYSKILQTRPYDNHTVEKVECRNHLLRNMCNKLAAISTETKYLLKFRKYITKKRILSTRKVIIESIKKHKNTNDITGLYRDILTAPDHAFGKHGNCKDYFCTKNKEDQEENIDQTLFSNSIWQRVKLITSQIAAHARSLIVDVDSNAVERYHSIVAKFVGGKRVNFTQRYQYQMRCNVAALAFNTRKPLSVLHKAIVGQSPRNQIRRNEQKKERSRLLIQKYIRKKRRLFEIQDTRNYGEDCSKPDMAEDMLSNAKQEFLKNLYKTTEERDRISRETILQSGSSEWMELRRNLLTASNFGRVIKRRLSNSCQNLVRDILYKKSIDHVSSIKHGKDSEKDALQQLTEQEAVKIEPCGLYIDPDVPYLGATPDGIINDQNNRMIVEVKCPKSSYNIGIDRAIEEKKIPFYKRGKDGLVINKEHNWYYQVQGQLHVTRMDKCLFAIWSGANFPIKTEIISRDNAFWTQKMQKKLEDFYLDCLLPEIIEKRHTRKMPIRDPTYVVEAILQKEQKNKSVPKKRKPTSEMLDHRTRE